MSNKISSDYIKKFALKSGIDFVGIASSDRFHGAPEGHKPTDLLKGAHSVIVCGNALPIGALECPGTLYHSVIQNMQGQLDTVALKIAMEIEKNGGMSIPVPAHGVIYYWDGEKQYARADLSLKHAAEAAGLGKIGKSSIFISKDFGILTRLVGVLSTLELEPDPILEDWNPCPQECTLCIDNCPMGAIKAANICEQSLCRKNIFKKTPRGVLFENCRECLKICPWIKNNLQ